MNRVGFDFFQARLETDVPIKMVPTVTYTARRCPVCEKWARTLVRPPQHELQCEICIDHCGGDAKYPSAYISFQGSWLRDGNSIIEALKGEIGPVGPQGPPGRTPTEQELRVLLTAVLQEHRDRQWPRRFWRKLFGRSV
jgi:hypothetical protein